jgi:HEAT repeat protein
MTLEIALANLQNPDPRVHLKSIRWLGVLGGPRAVEALVAALEHSSADVRTGAARALGSMEAREAVPALVRHFRQPQPVWDRAVYLKALGEIGGGPAVEVLIAALRDPSERIAGDACEALASLGDTRAIEPLRGLLEHPDSDLRRQAAAALIELKAADPRLQAAVERLAEAPEDEQQRAWGRHLQRELARLRGEDPGEEEEALTPVERERELQAGLAELRDPDEKTRQEGARRLRQVGGPEVLAALIAALEDPDLSVRCSVALTLGGLGAPDALPVLIQHLQEDPSPGVRQMCVAFLDAFDDERAADALLQSIADPDARVVYAACSQLGRKGDRRAIPALLPLLDHADRETQLCAARALLRLKSADARLVAALEQLARDPEAEDHDLWVAERIRDLPKTRRLFERMGDPAPEPGQTMLELVEEARRLLQQQGP